MKHLRLTRRLHQSLMDAATRIEHHTLPIGAVAALGYLFYYWLWEYVYPQSYESFSLRLAGALLYVLVMLRAVWPRPWQERFHWVWFITLTYTIPFLFSYFLLRNDFSHLWISTLMMGFFLTIMLVDWVALVVIWLLGICSAIIVFFMGEDSLTQVNAMMYFEDLFLFPFAILAGVTFRYLTDRANQQKLHGILAAATSIAHELRTPLLGIKSGVEGIRKFYPDLYEGYSKAKESGLAVKPIRAAHLDALSTVIERIKDETEYSNTIIDMLLINAGKKVLDDSQYKFCSVKVCIEKSLQRYPYGSRHDRDLTYWHHPKSDFHFWGSETLMVHVLFNLLKNSLYFVEKAGKGDIHIWISHGKDHNILHFKDTGAGIPRHVLPHIFEKFYSSTDEGTGIGLSFCKRVIKSFGGNILCYSVENEYTEFQVTFPHLGEGP